MANATMIQQMTVRERRPEDDIPKAELTPEEKAANDTSKKLVLYCASDLREPFQQMQADLMRVAMRTVDGYRFKVFDAGGDFGKQIDLLRDADNDKPVWLLIDPLDEHLISAVLESQHSRGTRIIGLDPRVSDQLCDALIYVDQKKIGKMAGDHVVESLRHKAKDEGKPTVSGRVVVIRGPANHHASNQRAEAFAEALKAEPGIIVVHEAPADWTPESGVSATKTALKLQKQFDVVFAHNDAMARGASEALAEVQMREQVLVMGVDGINAHEGGVDLVRTGVIDATIVQPMPLELAYQLVRDTIKDPNHRVPPKQEREPRLITPPVIESGKGW